MTLPPTEALSYYCLPEDVLLVLAGCVVIMQSRKHDVRSHIRNLVFPAVLPWVVLRRRVVSIDGSRHARFSFRKSPSICQAAGMSAKNASPLSDTTYKLRLQRDRRPCAIAARAKGLDRCCDGGEMFNVARRRYALGRMWPASRRFVICPWALGDGNCHFSKVRSARHIGERLLNLIKRKSLVDHRLHAVGCDRIHHRLKILY